MSIKFSFILIFNMTFQIILLCTHPTSIIFYNNTFNMLKTEEG